MTNKNHEIGGDPHSYYGVGQPRITNIDLNLYVDFGSNSLSGIAILDFDGHGWVSLDTRDLEIQKVSLAHGDMGDLRYTVAKADHVLGSKLTFRIPKGRRKVRIEYAASPKASGLQWLTPAQTAGGVHPFMYTQGQSIHARSYLPCQDTPSTRAMVAITLTIPKQLRAVVAASRSGRRTTTDDDATQKFFMDRPIPSYLIAFAVGDLESRELSDRSRVWAEPSVVDKAAAEFEDVPKYMKACEDLFGPYDWGRWDLLVLPPAFPYGGMENPCLTFVTPSLLAGDKSGAHVLIHELCHSWYGNRITNATCKDFWLNEGWTVWAEFRVMEVVYGRDMAMLSLKLLEREFDRDMARFCGPGGNREFTVLAPNLKGADPDDAFSRVPYFKGAMFHLTVEELVGRTRFDAFVRKYLDTFAFQSITTLDFLTFLGGEFDDLPMKVGDLYEWIYHPGGLPAGAMTITSPLIDSVERCVNDIELPDQLDKEQWVSQQWMLYLELVPRPMDFGYLGVLDRDFGMGDSDNADILYAFFMLVLESDALYLAKDRLVEFLCTQGRTKYLKPLYGALVKTPEGLALARELFAQKEEEYHSTPADQIRQILSKMA